MPMRPLWSLNDVAFSPRAQSGIRPLVSAIRSAIGRLFRLPGDAVAGLGVLPSIAQHTVELGEVVRLLGRIANDTEALLPVREDMARVADATAVLDALDDKVASVERAMPVLVEVQQHLDRLPETMVGLGDGIERLSKMMEHMLTSLDALATNVEELRGAVAPVGRLANRMPGQRKRAQAEA
jgi:hypothetical protein